MRRPPVKTCAEALARLNELADAAETLRWYRGEDIDSVQDRRDAEAAERGRALALLDKFHLTRLARNR